MTEREKLIEIIISSFDYCSKFYAALIADYLLSHGVTILVRCAECKYYRNHPNGLCYRWTEPSINAKGYKGEVHCVEPDDYCSCGERKDNGTA